MKKAILLAILATLLIAAGGATVTAAVKEYWHIQVINVETGCRLNYDDGWKVYGPAHDLLFEGSQGQAVRYLVRQQDCPMPPVTLPPG